MGRDAESVMEGVDHTEAEGAFVVEDFGNAVFPGKYFSSLFVLGTPVRFMT